jgi:hypothetical protein
VSWRARPVLGAVLALALLACLAPTAPARYDPVGSGTTAITLDRGFLGELKRNGVKLSAVAPATLRGRTVSFPVSGGKLDPAKDRGVVTHEGALLLRAGTRSIPLKDLQLKTTRRRAPFSVKAGGGQLELATVERLAVSRAGFGNRIAADALTLSAKVATRLTKKLRLRGVFEQGQKLGSTLTRVQPETVSIESQGIAYLTLDPGFAAKLASLFVAVDPIFPAERSGSTFTLPISGGALAPDASIGTLETSGAIEALQLGGGQVFWQETWLDLGAGSATVEADFRPSPPYGGKQGRIPIADLAAIAAIAANPRARTITVTGAALSLQAATATAFEETFARPLGRAGVFQTGEALGTISFTARGQ